jgi:hypothetical protein
VQWVLTWQVGGGGGIGVGGDNVGLSVAKLGGSVVVVQLEASTFLHTRFTHEQYFKIEILFPTPCLPTSQRILPTLLLELKEIP